MNNPITTTDHKLTFVHGDDWVGLYIDNDLVYENHSIDESHLLQVLGIESEYVWADRQLFEIGACPPHLNEVMSDDVYNGSFT